MVFAAAAKVGEVLVVAALQEGIRTHTLVRAAGTSEATPCGSITLALLSNISSRETSKNSYSSSGGRDRRRRRRPRVHFDHAETSKRIERLRLFLWKHRRSALHRLDVIATSVHNLDRYMKTIGPEPPYCNLRVTVNRWEASAPEWDSPTEASAATATVIDLGSASSGTGFSKRAIVYAVVQAGLHHCATGIVRTSNTGVGEFNHTVTLQGILPERDELVIAVVSKGFAGTEDAEMGLAVLSLRTLARKTETVLTLPLVRHAGSSDAHFKGLVQVRLFAVNFGGVPILSKGPTAFRERVQRLLYRYAPEQLHRTESLLVDYAGREGELVRELEQQYGPDVISSPMEIRIIGIRDFAPASGCYVKVYLDGEAVLRTSQHDGATHITFAANDVKNSVTVELYDPQHSRLRFKVAQHRYLQSITMSFAEIRLRNMVAGTANECWVPLFDSDGGLIGRLGVVLKSDGFIHREAAEVVRACEDVENDVASLLRKYRPRALPLLQPIMTETSNLETAHAEIRSRVATRPVAATVYVCIDSLCINRPDARQQQQRDWDEGGTHGEQTQTVTVNCDREEASIIWSAPEERQGAVVRLDIPDVGRRGHHELVITVKRQAAASGSLSRSGKVKSRSTSRSSRATSSRHTIHQTSSQAAEFGRVVVSLRALLTPSLYDASERITLPLVALMQESPVRKTLQQQSILQQQPSVVDVGFPCNDVIGEITLSVRLPVLEQVPSWLQLSSAQVEKHVAVDRAYIRYYEEQIRHLLADHEPHSLLDLHYTLYERDVAFGKWNLSLRDWKRALQRRFGVVNALPDSPPSCAAHAIKVGSGGAKVNAAEVDSYEEQSMCEK
ncbi:hypothetical protein DQ04_05621020 [Trypanosoma grayi]|uniref:hypothetical protein n=1 Tax=Trypanosoma grayi TaxID=71804 RepID=UPI0004F44F5B|nr:hypothetical protein DQ04_05621020 [Trypanosoma grayi]KEG09202.1 hypothetical protein DQ04_05621020 [Trypanosoma grayi]